MSEMKLTSLSEHVDNVWGEIGTPARDAMEALLKDEVDAYFVGEVIRKASVKQSLSEEELGERIGVKRSQISKKKSGATYKITPLFNYSQFTLYRFWGFYQIMPFDFSHFLPFGVRNQRRAKAEGSPTIPKIIKLPIIVLLFYPENKNKVHQHWLLL